MAKAIKSPLEMNGEQVRDIDALKEHFDVVKAVEYFQNGKLLAWLEDRYYDDEAEAVSQLSGNDPDVAGKLCAIFGVELPVDAEAQAERQERIARLRQYTDDQEVINSIDSVAFDQEDLADLYDRGVGKIYLCAGEFRIPKSKRNLTYILVGGAMITGGEGQQAAASVKEEKEDKLPEKVTPVVQEQPVASQPEESKSEKARKFFGSAASVLGSAASVLGNATVSAWGATTSALEKGKKNKEDKQLRELEYRFLKNTSGITKGGITFTKLAEKGNGRAMYFLGECYTHGYCGFTKNLDNAARWRKAGRDAGDVLATLNCAYSLPKESSERESIFREVINDVIHLAESGDVFAQFELADMYRYGYGVPVNEDAFIQWEIKSANGGFWKSMDKLASYYYDKGDYYLAFPWVEKASSYNPATMNRLGYMYQNGLGTETNEVFAYNSYKQAAEKGDANGQYNFGWCNETGYGLLCAEINTAREWYRKAVAQGHQGAAKRLKALENVKTWEDDMI